MKSKLIIFALIGSAALQIITGLAAPAQAMETWESYNAMLLETEAAAEQLAGDPAQLMTTKIAITGKVYGPARATTTEASDAITTSDQSVAATFVPLDLILSQISIYVGTNHNLALKLSQTKDNSSVLLVESGLTSLSALHALLLSQGRADVIEKAGEVYIAHRPVVLWNDATLAIKAGEKLLLNRENGAFLLNLGHLQVTGAEIGSVGGVNQGFNAFQPFILSVLTGSADINEAKIHDLGMPDRKMLEGLSFSAGGLASSSHSSTISKSTLQGLGSVAVYGTSNFKFHGNVVAESKGLGLSIANASDVSIEDNIISGAVSGSGLKVTGDAQRITISGNVMSRNAGNGIFVMAGPSAVSIRDNLIIGNAKSGIVLDNVACADVASNVIARSQQKGIVLKASAYSTVSSNFILSNGAGAHFSNATDHGSIKVSGNHFFGNRVGISGESSPQMVLEGNDFQHQSTRLLGGEYAQYSNALLTHLVAASAAAPITIGAPSTGLEPQIAVPLQALADCMGDQK